MCNVSLSQCQCKIREQWLNFGSSLHAMQENRDLRTFTILGFSRKLPNSPENSEIESYLLSIALSVI